VNDWHDVLAFEETSQCVFRILMAAPTVDVAMREQKLRNVELMFCEHRGIEMHQLRLTDRGACLPGRQIERTFFEPDNAHSGGNRTAGDDDALAPATNELRHIGSQTAKLFVIE